MSGSFFVSSEKQIFEGDPDIICVAAKKNNEKLKLVPSDPLRENTFCVPKLYAGQVVRIEQLEDALPWIRESYNKTEGGFLTIGGTPLIRNEPDELNRAWDAAKSIQDELNEVNERLKQTQELLESYKMTIETQKLLIDQLNYMLKKQ